MAEFAKLGLTDAGRLFIAKIATSGLPPEITRCAAGDGVAPSSWETLTDLINRVVWVPIMSFELLSPGVWKLSISITSDMITSNLELTELGVYALDPDDGEVLIAYTYTDTPDVIPVTGVATTVAYTYDLVTTLGNAPNVVFDVNAPYTLVLRSQSLTSTGAVSVTLDSSITPGQPLEVYLNGARTTAFSVSGTVLTFVTAPASGTSILITQYLIVPA